MSRNPRNVQQPVVDPAPEEEVNQINPNDGNGEGSSNTFNGAIQVPPGGNPNNDNNLSNEINALIKAQVTTAQAIEQTLQYEVKALQRKQELVDAIN